MQDRLAVGEHQRPRRLRCRASADRPAPPRAGRAGGGSGTVVAVPATAPGSESIIPESLPSHRKVSVPVDVQIAACRVSTAAAPFAFKLASSISKIAGSASNAVMRAAGYRRWKNRLARPTLAPQSRMRGDVRGALERERALHEDILPLRAEAQKIGVPDVVVHHPDRARREPAASSRPDATRGAMPPVPASRRDGGGSRRPSASRGEASPSRRPQHDAVAQIAVRIDDDAPRQHLGVEQADQAGRWPPAARRL